MTEAVKGRSIHTGEIKCKAKREGCLAAGLQYAQKVVKEWHDEQQPLRNSDAVPIRPERLCKELTGALPSDAVLVADTGYSGIWTGTMVYLTHPEQRYIRASGSLGWAVLDCGQSDLGRSLNP